MNIDIGELSMMQLLNFRSYFETLSDKVHLYVKATPAVLTLNPMMVKHVHGVIEGEAHSGHIVLNISTSAVRNLRRNDQNLVFGAHFQGIECIVSVPLGDIIGMSTETGEHLVLDPMALITTSLNGGGVILRPVCSLHREDTVPAGDPPRQRPVLTVVK